MSDENNFITTVSLRADQKDIIQLKYSQQFSEHVRHLADALIAGVELDKLPPELAERVVYSRRMANIRQENLRRETQLKENFFIYLNKRNFANYISKYSKRKVFKIGKEFAFAYSGSEGAILPECFIQKFLKEYYDNTIASQDMIDAYLNRINLKSESEIAEGV